MNHDTVSDELREQAALYALGVMTTEESAAFDEHLGAGCVICQAEVAAFEQVALFLAETIPRVDPPPSLGRRLLAMVHEDPTEGSIPDQIWKRWESDVTEGPYFVARSGEGEWLPTGSEGVLARKLFVDAEADRVTMLIRMRPGSSYPAHRHAAVEECFVLSGDLRIEETVLRTGDYQRAVSGQIHPVQSTEEGCLLLIVSSLHDEILA